MPDLSDRRVWDDLLAPFTVAERQMLEQAATAEADDHLRMRGRLEGLRHALSLLHETRKRVMKAAGDPLL